MRILSVTPYYEPEGGGLERYAHEILRRLAAMGHEVEARAFTRGRPIEEKIDGVPVERVRPLFLLGNAPIHPAFSSHIARSIRRLQPDVIVAHTPVPGAAEAAFASARTAHVPFVTTYHAGRLRGSSLPLRWLGRVDRATLERRMLRGSSRLIAVSPYVRDHALSGYDDKVTIIPPGVDTSEFAPDGSVPGPDILFVAPLARAYRWKGLDVLLEAFPLVQKEIPEATLTLVGDGDRRPEVASWARERAGVRLEGRVSRPSLVQAYRKAAVVALPSITDAEAFGMVLAEANACGRPVVASRIGGIPDFVRDGHNGVLVAPASARDLSDGLVRVLTDPAAGRRMGEAGRALVLREHGWDGLASRTLAVLEEAAAVGAPTART